jgi:hypothetical protein
VQASPTVQAFPSLHAAALLVWTQPVATSHESSVQGFPSSHVLLKWTQPTAGSQASFVHGLSSLQPTGVPAWHEPASHASFTVQTLPSSHGAELKWKTQPTAGLQSSLVQGLLSSQTTEAPAWHVPPLQVSPVVHALPSLQGSVLFV